MPDLVPGDAASLEIPSHPRHLCLVRTMVRSFAALAGFGERQVDRIALAVDEACTNVMRHAYGGREDGELTVVCRLEEPGTAAPCQLVIRLQDHGGSPPGDCLPVREPADALVPGGLGLRLMRDIMDGVEFSRAPDGANVLELRLDVPDSPPLPGPDAERVPREPL